jgi:hypothetical protein
MNIKYCKCCASLIESERLEILPNTSFCAPCAQKIQPERAKKGIMVWGSKDCAEMQTVTAEYFDNNKSYFLPNSGLRSVVKNFSKNIAA